MRKTNIARRRGTTIAAAALSLALVAPVVQPVVNPAAAPEAFAQDAADPAAPGDAAAPASAFDHVYWANGGEKGPTQPELQSDGSYRVDAIESGQITNATQLSAAKTAGYSVVSGRASVVSVQRSTQLTATYDALDPYPDNVPVYFQWIDNDGAVSPVYSAVTHELEGAAGSGGRGMYAFAVPQWTDAHGKVHEFKTTSDRRYRVWADPFTKADTGNKVFPLRTAPGFFPGAFDVATGSGLGDFPGDLGTGGNIQRTGVWGFEQGTSGDYYRVADDSKKFHDDSGEFEDRLNNDKEISGRVWLESGNERQLFTGGTRVGNSPAIGYKVFVSWLTPEGASANESRVTNNQQPWKRAEETKKMLTEHPEYLAGTAVATTNDEGRYRIKLPDETYSNDLNSTHNIYMWVEDPKGNIVDASSSFTQPVFANPRYNQQWAPTLVPGYQSVRESWQNVNFALLPYTDVKLDITNYNSTDNPAEPGDVAELKLEGTLPQGSKVQWRNSRGTVLKECEVSDAADLKGCETFDVPADSFGQTFWAVLNNGANDIAADSFVVIDKGDAADFVPRFDDVETNPGTPAPIDSPTFTDRDGNEVTPPEGTDYKVTEVPEGWEIADNGKSVTPPKGTKPGDYTVTTTVTYPDGTTDTVPVTVKVRDDAGIHVHPQRDVTATVNKEMKRIPLTVEGNPAKLADNAKIEVKGLPEGVTYDERSRSIGGTPSELGNYPVEVTVTSEDGEHTETQKFNIHVIAADVNDTDNDGLTDEEENQPEPRQNRPSSESSPAYPESSTHHPNPESSQAPQPSP